MTSEEPVTETVDIVAALRASIEAAKKRRAEIEVRRAKCQHPNVHLDPDMLAECPDCGAMVG